MQPANSRARDIQRKTAHDLDVLKGTPARVAKLLAELRRNAGHIKTSRDLTPEAKARHLRDVRETAGVQLEALVADADDARRNVEAEAELVRANPDLGDPTEQLLRELQLQRAWARTERLLASGSTISEVVIRAARELDSATLDALRAEITGYLLERGAAQREIDATHAVINDHEDVVLSPDQLAAKTARKDADRHAYFGGMALAQAREEVNGGQQWSSIAAGPDSVLAVEG